MSGGFFGDYVPPPPPPSPPPRPPSPPSAGGGALRLFSLLTVAGLAAALILQRENVGRLLGGNASATSDRGWGAVSQVVTHDLPPTPDDVGAQPLGYPAPAPPGEGGYAFLLRQPRNGLPVAFDPCRPIHYVIRPDGEPPDGRAAIQDGIAEISRVTGLVFVYDGLTLEAPGAAPGQDREAIQRDRYGNRWAPVLIAWSDEIEAPVLRGQVLGVSAPQSISTSGSNSRRYVTGLVVLDGADLGRMAQRQGAAAVRAVILHELAHLVGLDHVDDQTQLMYPQAGRQRNFAPGDLRGLHELGLGACFHDG